MRRLTCIAACFAIACFVRTDHSVAKISLDEKVLRPNVIVFLSDDQGYGDFSHTGNNDIATPNIDSLAKDGAFAANFYVCPVCSPTRAEFLTGRYSARCGVYSTSAGGERIDLDESTIADAFHAAGYATAAFGKWHNGMQAPFHPNTRGFDEFYGFCSGHWGHYFDPILEHNGDLVRGKGFCVDDFTDHAIKFIEDNREKPFFVYVPYNTPHSPMQVPDKFWEKFKDKELTQMPPEFKKFAKQKGKGIDHARAALAMCENIDYNVGRVLSKLDELKLSENTIVMYFCDNGPNGSRYNAGLKGRKGSTDEGGIRTPLFTRWPAKIKPGSTVKTVAGAIDLYPTLADLCGIPPTPKKPFDGISFGDQLTGTSHQETPRHFFSYWKGKSSVRRGQYRLDTKQVLYDLEKDPGQKSPVRDKPEVRNRLIEAVQKFKRDVVSELDPNSIRVFPVGHPGMKKTQIPARDGVVTGKLKRSNKFPNCSYFTNWVDTNDTISWPIEVIESGKFKVKLHYCLSPENVGTTMELSFGSNKITTEIGEAHESKLIGPDDDRSIRGESVVKNFKPMELGVIELEKGVGDLILRTTEISGSESIEFRLLMFERIE
jgi:arylsulfatase A-like enzyme